MTNPFLSWLSRKINYPLVRPQVIQVSLTYRCNLKCKMCSIVNLLPENEELSTSQIFHMIEEAKKYDIEEVLLTGGEPFLRRDIFAICEYVHKTGMRSVITTNGALIDDNLAKEIIRSRINHLHFSLDGLEDTNDFFRGKGTFRKTINAIKILNEKKKDNHFFSTGIACTVMDRNVKELCEIVRLADDIEVNVINFQPLVKDNTNVLDNRLSEYWIKDDDMRWLKQEIEKLRAYKLKQVTIYEEPKLELLAKYYERRLTKKDWICFGGFKTVFICFDKNKPLVYSCHGICGNLNEVSLKNAWTSKEAYRLRMHSKNCKNLCMQSCYSQESAQSLYNAARFCLKSLRVKYNHVT